MLIHGFADDNVTVAHTLRLSSALLTAGLAAHRAAAVRDHALAAAGRRGGEPDAAHGGSNQPGQADHSGSRQFLQQQRRKVRTERSASG